MKTAEATKFQDHLTIGVSAVVEVTEGDLYGNGNGNGPKVGDIGIVIRQKPEGSYRYEVMIPGNPMTFWMPVSKLRTLQGVDHRNWWMRDQ